MKNDIYSAWKLCRLLLQTNYTILNLIKSGYYNNFIRDVDFKIKSLTICKINNIFIALQSFSDM